MGSAIEEYDELLRDAAWRMSRIVVAEDGEGVSLRVEARSGGPERVALRFDGVSQLVLRQGSGFPLDLQIVDVGDAGLEGIAFRVTDPGNDIASFWCAEFRIERAEESDGFRDGP
ncbi:hypothetical protein [Actinosynnema mirum]|uniref:Uncharacterized protein n=1 Tax=Actinosynnema mirum (strain ATCC 29888 / DSM 43827 / JCM 3225 / NBRC 14064 / NCIMB 13271 / NRRL B-12336 / IMRU 3971 / 101) TaxID=446462 RepID=C6WAX7_ACTMD|nr:hypothetical protein [Actinosynnema mirum]ACU37446.1 hypothetical protein Amir_3555 [Actinosynnema mirum DSM 43827]